MTEIAKHAADLERLLKLRSIPFGMKLFENRADMEVIPKIRRPGNVHTLDQVVAQASRLGWTVGITSEDLVGAQCRAVVGLGNAKDPKWQSGQHMVGVWFSTPEDAEQHQAACHRQSLSRSQCHPNSRERTGAECNSHCSQVGRRDARLLEEMHDLWEKLYGVLLPGVPMVLGKQAAGWVVDRDAGMTCGGVERKQHWHQRSADEKVSEAG